MTAIFGVFGLLAGSAASPPDTLGILLPVFALMFALMLLYTAVRLQNEFSYHYYAALQEIEHGSLGLIMVQEDFADIVMTAQRKAFPLNRAIQHKHHSVEAQLEYGAAMLPALWHAARHEPQALHNQMRAGLQTLQMGPIFRSGSVWQIFTIIIACSIFFSLHVCVLWSGLALPFLRSRARLVAFLDHYLGTAPALPKEHFDLLRLGLPRGEPFSFERSLAALQAPLGWKLRAPD